MCHDQYFCWLMMLMADSQLTDVLLKADSKVQSKKRWKLVCHSQSNHGNWTSEATRSMMGWYQQHSHMEWKNSLRECHVDMEIP